MNKSYQVKQSDQPKSGFTLIELLVVIAIIGSLAAVSFPVYRSIQNKMEKQATGMIINALEIAVDNFETEYNYLPYFGDSYPDEATWLYGENGDSQSLMTVLVAPDGANDADIAANFKRIRFFECREPNGGPGNYTNGLLVTDTTAELYRPWLSVGGVPCAFRRWRLDYDADGQVATWPPDGGVAQQKIMFFDWGADDTWRTSDDVSNYPHPNLDDLTE